MNINYVRARTCAIACQESYKPFSAQQFEDNPETISHIENSLTDTQCTVIVTGSEMIIAFRGSNSSIDWKGNLDSSQMRSRFDQQIVKRTITDSDEREEIYPYEDPNKTDVKLHRGFSRAYFSVRDEIHQHIERSGISHVTVTGHSLGGALAIICAVDIQYNFAEQLQHWETYTFGAPKPGNPAFKASYERRVPNTYCFAYGMDLVVELPRWWQGYPRHVATQVRIGPRLSWQLLTAPFKDHAIEKYVAELTARAASSRA